MKYLSALLFCCCSVFLFAQMQRNYSSYNVDNGLAQNTVWDAFQDCRGFLWFGTADGINRFDGYNMYHYRNEMDNSRSIYGTTGFNFYEDAQQQLWVGHDRGLSLYDRVHNSFNNFYKNANGVSIMGTDSSGLLWVVSAAKFLYAFDRKTLQQKHKVFINQSWHNSYGSIISSVKIGNTFYIGFSNDVLVQFKPQSLAYKSTAIPYHFGNTLFLLDSNRFCSFFRSRATICTLVGDSLMITFKKYDFADSAKLYFSGGTLYNGKLFAGGQAGLFVFNKNTLMLEDCITNFTNKQNDSYAYVQTVRKDNNNNLLICTNGAGVYVYSPYKNKFRHYTNYSPRKSLFKAIVATSNGTIYGGTYAEGITVFDSNGTYSFLRPQVQDPIKTIHAFHKISDDELLYVSAMDVVLYNAKKRTHQKLITDRVYPSSTYPFFQQVGNQIWLNRNNPNDAAIFDVLTNRKILNIPNNDICCHKKISDTLVWLGTKKGLWRYNLRTHQYTPTAIKDFVKSILISSAQKVYVGTIVGLYVLTAQGNVERHYSTANQLNSNFIYGVLEDGAHHIWFSHNSGISMFNPANGRFKHYGVADGLQSNEFNTGAYYKDEKGLLYFGGVNGINVIDPANIVENKLPPRISINEILLGDVPYITDTAYNEIRRLHLTYLENTLSFDFSALEFSQPEKTTYQYKMVGVDGNWIQSGTKHFARYASLPPGTYTFMVKAANGDGVWNQTPREIEILIEPPYWQTTWFYSLAVFLLVLLLVGAGYLVVVRQKARLQRELEMQQKLEEERLRISRDLHDNVGAQLSYLITNIEWMLEHPDELSYMEEQQRLKALSETGRNAILTLRQTIWAISNTTLSVEDFTDRFKQFALKMLEFNSHMQVHFEDDFNGNRNLSPAVALNMFRICQEAFNNCLKHAQCSEINIRFESNESVTFGCTIRDNGIGFDWNKARSKGHYGLVNMQARASETGATLKIQSEQGKGTSLFLQIK